MKWFKTVRTIRTKKCQQSVSESESYTDTMVSTKPIVILLLLTVDIQPGTPHPGAWPGTPYPWLSNVPLLDAIVAWPGTQYTLGFAKYLYQILVACPGTQYTLGFAMSLYLILWAWPGTLYPWFRYVPLLGTSVLSI